MVIQKIASNAPVRKNKLIQVKGTENVEKTKNNANRSSKKGHVKKRCSIHFLEVEPTFNRMCVRNTRVSEVPH